MGVACSFSRRLYFGVLREMQHDCHSSNGAMPNPRIAMPSPHGNAGWLADMTPIDPAALAVFVACLIGFSAAVYPYVAILTRKMQC